MSVDDFINIILALATIIMAWKTWTLASETRRALDNEIRPILICEPMPFTLHRILVPELVLKNYGKGPALGLRICMIGFDEHGNRREVYYDKVLNIPPQEQLQIKIPGDNVTHFGKAGTEFVFLYRDIKGKLIYKNRCVQQGTINNPDWRTIET